MDPKLTFSRTCPECQSPNYAFRSRKNIPAEPGQEQGTVETKYRCKACAHEWRERLPVRSAA